MTVSDENWPLIGATGARFGSAGRRRSARKDQDPSPPQSTEWVEPGPAEAAPEQVEPAPEPAGQAPETIGSAAAESTEWVAPEDTVSIVRPFILTGGRTESGVDLPLEALIVARPDGDTVVDGMPAPDELRRVLALCSEPRSVAEIASLASIPLGVARVLVGDLAAAGAVTVNETAGSTGPDRKLMERVLDGLRKL
ncbi:DUF742 domain-containing protein [Rhodococcus wratislaviensis]|uniref:CvnC protein n=1 Tax=Rhodococcus wratislaviensis NBRC 100605 TaxID=1219028 RepID=X0RAK9_RHOWR|nr:DUF742 domain-containing protein [Rhodococcus wratislaviensis]GAF48020.1 hypothetical protein RW1_048_00150 [Rhodococcus wratislaviensis NBRC 100605]